MRKPFIGPRHPAYFTKTGRGQRWEMLVLNEHKTTGSPYETFTSNDRAQLKRDCEARRAEIADGITSRKGGRTLGELLDAWLASVSDSVSADEKRERTFVAYSTSAKRVTAELRGKLAHEIAPSELVSFRSAQLKRYDAKTVKQTFNVIAQALDFGIRDDTATGGPLAGKPNIARQPYMPKLAMPKTRTAPKACPRKDREAIRAALPGAHRVIVDLCYGAGLRIAEARTIGPRNLNVAARTLLVSGQARGADYAAPVKSRNGQDRIVPIPAWLVTVLVDHERLYGLSREGTYAHSLECDAPMGDSTWQRALKRARTKAGVAVTWTAHSWRHAFASEHLANHVDVATVAAWMGDDAETVWRTYVHPTKAHEHPTTELPAPPARMDSVGRRHLQVA